MSFASHAIRSCSIRYTNISNAYFKKEMIDEVEKTFGVDERVLLDISDVSTIVEIGSEWKKFAAGSYDTEALSAGETETPKVTSTNEIEQNDKNTDADDVLVEGVARINLWDSDGKRQVELAYIKDQDGLLLGYDQFSHLKKNSGDEDDKREKNGNATTSKKESVEPQSKSLIGKVGECNFHVNPQTTKYIQIFALYRSPLEDSDITNSKAPAEASPSNKVMFYSSLIPMEKVKIQDNVVAADDDDKGHSREINEQKSS